MEEVYALVCVVYEMLAGEPPFTASNAQALIAKIVADRALAQDDGAPGVFTFRNGQ